MRCNGGNVSEWSTLLAGWPCLISADGQIPHISGAVQCLFQLPSVCSISQSAFSESHTEFKTHLLPKYHFLGNPSLSALASSTQCAWYSILFLLILEWPSMWRNNYVSIIQLDSLKSCFHINAYWQHNIAHWLKGKTCSALPTFWNEKVRTEE